MIALDAFTKQLRIKLGGSVATQLVWNVSCLDDPGWANLTGITNNTTVVTMCTGIAQAPTAPYPPSRKISTISVYNADTATQDVSIIYFNGTAEFLIVVVSLDSGFTLHYDSDGWYVTDTTGSRVSSMTTVTSNTLHDVLVNGNETGGEDIVITTGDKITSDVPGASEVSFGAGGDELRWFPDGSSGGGNYLIFKLNEFYIDGNWGSLNSSPTLISLSHTLQLNLNAPDVMLQQSTPDTVPYLDSNKFLKSSAVTPTELAYLSGVTSAIQTQLGAKQPLDSDLTSWAGVTRASGFDTFAATPSSANLASLLTDESGTGLVLFGSGVSVDFSGTANPTGFSSSTVTYAVYWQIGSMRIIQLDVTGTSNAATFTVTLPFNSLRASATPCRVTDNSSVQAAVGVASLTAGSPTLTFGKAFTAVAGFTGSGTKRAQLSLLIIEV